MDDNTDDYIDFEEVKRITGYCRAQIDRLERVPKYMGDDPFPVRFEYGTRRVMWLKSEVRAWRLRRIARQLKPRPAPPRKGVRLPPLPFQGRDRPDQAE